MSSIVQRATSWPGLSEIKHLFIFGDSYSSTLASHFTNSNRPIIPTTADPLGIPFPGHVFNEAEKPNWVGHFITKYRPGPLYLPNEDQDPGYLAHPLFVFNYAIGGNTVHNVANSQMKVFLNGAGAKPEWAPWTREDSLFVIWIGINDCAFSSTHKQSFDILFGAVEKLYEAGARNFAFIDVPPIHRSPAVATARAQEASQSFLNWNACLSERIPIFSASHPDATTMLFSAFETFNVILDSLKEHNMTPGHAHKTGGEVWVDRLHPTSAVHNHIARYFAKFVGSV